MSHYSNYLNKYIKINKWKIISQRKNGSYRDSIMSSYSDYLHEFI